MKPRRWFRFSLRTFFVLLTLFGAWLGYQVNWIRQRSEALKQIRSTNEPYAVTSDPDAKRFDGKGAPWIVRATNNATAHHFMILQKDFPAEKASGRIQRLRRLFPEATFSVFQEPGELRYRWKPGEAIE